MTRLANHHAEKELIGGLLLHNDSYVEVHDILTPEGFDNPAHAVLYRAFGETWRQNEPVDLHTLVTKAGVSIDVAVDCMDTAVLGAQRRTALLLMELAHKREVEWKAKALIQELPELELDDLAGRLTKMALSITQTEGKKVYDSKELCRIVIDTQEERSKDPGYIRGIKTGHKHLDVTIRGLRPKRMTLLVAATGFGKSTLALNYVSNIVSAGHKALLISTENDAADNLDRLCGIITGIDLKHIEAGTVAQGVCKSFVERFKDKSLWISDNSPRNIHEVIGTITRYVLQYGVEVVFVDYIGEISGAPERQESEEQMLARYGQMLVDAAKGLNCHIVVLAQLNRKGNEKGRPSKTELQGCFRLAQKAHSMLIFWQHESGQDIVSVDKNRQGPPKVDIGVRFKRNTQRIDSIGMWIERSQTVVDLDGTVVDTTDRTELPT